MFWENTESYETNVFMPWLWKLLPFIDSLVIIHGRYLCRDREVMLVNEWNQLLKAIHRWWNHILITLLAKICIRCLFRQFSQNMSVDILVIDITEVSLFPLMAPYLIHSRVIYQGILTHPLNPEKYCFQSKAEQIYIKNNILKQCHVLQCKLSCNWASVVAVFDVFIFLLSPSASKSMSSPLVLPYLKHGHNCFFHHWHRFWPNWIKYSPEIPKL